MLSYQIALPIFILLNCFFYAFTLWNHSVGYPRANRYIALLFIMIGLSIMQDIFRDAPVQYAIFAYAFFHPLTMIMGVSLYYFLKTLTNSDTKPIPYLIYHLIPICVTQALILIYILIYVPYKEVNLWDLSFVAWLERPLQIYVMVYIVLAYRLITRHEQILRYYVSSQSIHDLLWVKKIIWAGIGLWISWTFLFSINLFLALSVHFFSLFYLFIVALRQKPTTAILEVSYKDVLEIEQNGAKSKEIDPRLEAFKSELLDFMMSKKPYLDPELSLPKLAQTMGVTTHFLSQAINTSMDENFFTFINRYRVEESKKLLHDPEKSHFNILQIAYEAGFNSKTTFNTVFKKMAGVSPSVFQKQKAY